MRFKQRYYPETYPHNINKTSNNSNVGSRLIEEELQHFDWKAHNKRKLYHLDWIDPIPIVNK